MYFQSDMLTQEANYKQIQDAKSMVEDDLQHKLEEFEEERERLLKLANTASTLERDLEQVVMPKETVLLFRPCMDRKIIIVFCSKMPFTLLR